MYARARKKPLWKLVVDFTPQELVDAMAWRYISDAITREEALEMFTKLAGTKAEREANVRELGYPAYVTSAGWMGYSDEKVARLTKEAVAAGFNTFKMKVWSPRGPNVPVLTRTLGWCRSRI
jgi:L-fuconate dehydratase